MRRNHFAVLLLSIFVLCGLSFADSTFNFNAGTGAFSSFTDTFNSGGVSLTVDGYASGGTTTDLYFKNGGGDETGLGLVNSDTDHEIAGTNFIEFTSTGAIKTITIGSVQTGEGWALYGSSSAGTLGTLLISSSSSGAPSVVGGLVTLNVPADCSGCTYYSLAVPVGAAGDILLDSITTTSVVPEPSTPAFMIVLGVVGLAEVGRRKLFA